MDQLQPQIDKLAPVVKEAQAKLHRIDSAVVAERSGATIDQNGSLRISSAATLEVGGCHVVGR